MDSTHHQSGVRRCVCKNLLTVCELSWFAEALPVTQLLQAVQSWRVEQQGWAGF